MIHHRRLVLLAALVLARAGTTTAVNTTLDWIFAPDVATRIPVPECSDDAGIRVTSGASASLIFDGGAISLYGPRYAAGAAALFVVDSQFLEAAHVDESLGAGPEGECALLASFNGLNQATRHNLTVIVNGPAVNNALTFTVANVSTIAPVGGPEGHSITEDSGSKGVPIAIIIGPTIAGLIIISWISFLFYRRAKRRRHAHKAPSAAFRAELATYSSGGTDASRTLFSIRSVVDKKEMSADALPPV